MKISLIPEIKPSANLNIYSIYISIFSYNSFTALQKHKLSITKHKNVVFEHIIIRKVNHKRLSEQWD